MEQLNLKRTFLISLIVSLSVSALAGIFVFLLGSFGDIEMRILGTTLTIGVFSLTGLCASILYERRRYLWLATTGMVASVLGFILTEFLIWEVIGIYNDDMWKIALICLVVAFSAAHSSLLLLIQPAKPLVRAVLNATLVSIAIVATMLSILILFEFDLFNSDIDFYYRLLGVFAILDVLGTIVTPILKKVT